MRPITTRPIVLVLLYLSLASWTADPATAAIPDRITTVTLTLPTSLEPGQFSWCTMGTCTLSPRLYHAPLADGRTLVGWTDAALNGHVSVASGSTITATFDYPARPVRGLVGHDDGSFAVLLWDRGGAAIEDDVMWLSRRTAANGETWVARVTSVSNVPSAAGSKLGDSRLAYGGGVYGAYLAVHGISGFATGHEGDEYTRLDDAGGALSGDWSWGLSHSMAELIGWHPQTSVLTAIGSSDCYPGKGLYAGNSRLLWAADGDCAGNAQAQLGQMAAATNQRWLVAFSAPNRAGFPAQGIGLARFGSDGTVSIAWLTSTAGAEERDPVLARIGTSLGSNRFLAGWRMQTAGTFQLAVVDTLGALIEGPTAPGAGVSWGNRDDSFRTRSDGSVSWVQGAAGSNTLKLHRYAEATVGVETPREPVAGLEVQHGFPNPLREGTAQLRFQLSEGRAVRARVVDAAGRMVKTLRSGWLSAGAHEVTWDGRDANGAAVTSGLYFCVFESAGVTTTRKLAVMR